MNTELVVNLWAIYDANTGFVYALSGRAYNVSGNDKEKSSLLKSLSTTDYITAKRYKVPERFEISFSDGTTKTGVTFLNEVNNPHADLFGDVFRNIESELPPLPDFSSSDYQYIQQKIPDDPLCVITVLYEDETGSIKPIITDEDRAWVSKHQQMLQDLSN